VTTTPDNPFAALDVGERYRRGRPYHHPRSLARVRALAGAEPATGRALDVACGTGMSARALADVADLVVGLDASREMLRAAPVRAGVTYMLGDAERMPFADACFDALTCSSGVHWLDQERFFAEVARIVRPRGWIGLYDHYFFGMPGVDEFPRWVDELFARYPLPPRNPQVGDPRLATPAGFGVVGTDSFEDPIEMTREEFVDYEMTISNCVAAVERGVAHEEIRDWLFDSTDPLFGGASRTVQFIGSITCLRRLP